MATTSSRFCPAEHAARVQAISWLAGNLLRDRVNGIVTSTSDTKPALADMPALEAASPEQSPRTVSGVDSPPRPVQPPPSDVPATTVSPASVWAPPDRPRCATGFHSPGERSWKTYRNLGMMWRTDVRRFTDGRRFYVGASLEGTDGGGDAEMAGVAGHLGWVRRRGHWALETSLGAGLDVARVSSVVTTTPSSTVSSANGFVAVSRDIGDAVHLFLRLGAHISTVNESDWFMSPTLGVSYGA